MAEAFASFISDSMLFALPLTILDTTLQVLSPIPYPKGPKYTFQQALNALESVLDFKTALYLVLRHSDSLVLVTFLPYPATTTTKSLFLSNRNKLLKSLGEENFSSSIICKEIGEITDARSWDERGGSGRSWDSAPGQHEEACDVDTDGVEDGGYKKNKCRLCDRRMKNPIDDDALDALKGLTEAGECVQLVSLPYLHTVFITNDYLGCEYHHRRLVPHIPFQTPRSISHRITHSPSYA